MKNLSTYEEFLNESILNEIGEIRNPYKYELVSDPEDSDNVYRFTPVPITYSIDEPAPISVRVPITPAVIVVAKPETEGLLVIALQTNIYGIRRK